MASDKGEHYDDNGEDDDNDDDDELAKQGSEANHFGSGKDPGVAKARPGTLVAERSPWWPKCCKKQKMSKIKVWLQKSNKSTPKPNFVKKAMWLRLGAYVSRSSKSVGCHLAPLTTLTVTSRTSCPGGPLYPGGERRRPRCRTQNTS